MKDLIRQTFVRVTVFLALTVILFATMSIDSAGHFIANVFAIIVCMIYVGLFAYANGYLMYTQPWYERREMENRQHD